LTPPNSRGAVGDPARRGDHLIGGKVEPNRVVSGLLVPGLVPGDERGPLPAAGVMMRQYRIPIEQVGDTVVMPPAAPVVRKVENEVGRGLDHLSRSYGALERDGHDCVEVRVERESGRLARDADRGGLQTPPLRVHRLVGTEPENPQRLGQYRLILVLDLEPRV